MIHNQPMRTAKRNQAQWDAFEASLISREPKPITWAQVKRERVIVWFVGIPLLVIGYGLILWRVL